MTRKLSILFAAISLLACAAVCTTWARSYARSEKLTWRGEHGQHSLRSAPGHVVLSLYAWYPAGPGPIRGKPGLSFERDQPTPATLELMTIFLLCSDATARTAHWEHGGFAWSQRSSSRDLIVTGVAPFWGVTLAAGAQPLGWSALRLVALLRRRRSGSTGLCPSCGYDLRATPDRCPECGTSTAMAGTGRFTAPASA
jgi:hypothetical protein